MDSGNKFTLPELPERRSSLCSEFLVDVEMFSLSQVESVCVVKTCLKKVSFKFKQKSGFKTMQGQVDPNFCSSLIQV